MSVSPWEIRAYENAREVERYKLNEARRWQETHGSGDSSNVVGAYFDESSGGYRPLVCNEPEDTGGLLYGESEESMLARIGRQIYGD